jgi:hypothetical protein
METLDTIATLPMLGSVLVSRDAYRVPGYALPKNWEVIVTRQLFGVDGTPLGVMGKFTQGPRNGKAVYVPVGGLGDFFQPQSPELVRLHTAADWAGEIGLYVAARRMGVDVRIIDYPYGTDSYDATYTVVRGGDNSGWGITVHNPSGAAYATRADMVRI